MFQFPGSASARADDGSLHPPGFPIRTSRDPRMLAPPPSFSQLATSFFAWSRLGIPRTLLPRLVCPCPALLDDHTRFCFLKRSSQLPTPMFSISSPPSPGVRPGPKRPRGRNGTRRCRCRTNQKVGLFVWCDVERVFRAPCAPRGWEAYSPCSRKEVIQPQVPLRLPCYDFAPVTELAFGRSLQA